MYEDAFSTGRWQVKRRKKKNDAQVHVSWTEIHNPYEGEARTKKVLALVNALDLVLNDLRGTLGLKAAVEVLKSWPDEEWKKLAKFANAIPPSDVTKLEVLRILQERIVMAKTKRPVMVRVTYANGRSQNVSLADARKTFRLADEEERSLLAGDLVRVDVKLEIAT